jgi:hypothetical protein
MTDYLEAARQRVVVSIGQLSAADKRTLDRAAKAGTISKWRGYWHPVRGAPFGIGPLKTCYGPHDVCATLSSFKL